MVDTQKRESLSDHHRRSSDQKEESKRRKRNKRITEKTRKQLTKWY